MSEDKIEIVHLGELEVDSGSLLITDPNYINTKWKDTPFIFNEYFFDMETEETIESPRMRLDEGITFESIYRDNMTYNEAIRNGILKRKDEELYPTGEFSIDGCYRSVMKGLGSSLNFELGNSGAGVVFRCAFGDGVYDVFAIVKDFGMYGKRITKVIIDLIPNEDDEDNNLMSRMSGLAFQKHLNEIKETIKKELEQRGREIEQISKEIKNKKE